MNNPMPSSKQFLAAPLEMVQRDYVEPTGDTAQRIKMAVSLWAVYTYELAILIAKENKIKIPKNFPYWDSTGAITLHMEYDYERIFKSTPISLNYLRASKPHISFVWLNSFGSYSSVGVFSEDAPRFFRTYKFPLAFLLTRPSYEPIFVEYSEIVKAYQEVVSLEQSND